VTDAVPTVFIHTARPCVIRELSCAHSDWDPDLARIDLTAKPLMERKRNLAETFEPTPTAVLTEYVEGDGGAFYGVCKEHGLERLRHATKVPRPVG